MGSQTVSSLSGDGLGKKRDEREWTAVMRERRSDEGESRPLIKRGFTEAQRKELEEQAVINRHISAGLPVPLHLVLPIWKSVVTSLGPSYPIIYKQFPSFIGFIIQGFDCRNVMDPEPGRCRRTDGKKWRCSRDVLSDQKYCERHIHRGRQRSRKLVDAQSFASPSRALKPEKPKAEPTQTRDSNLSVSVGLQLMTPSSGDSIATGFSHKRISRVTSNPNPAAQPSSSLATVFPVSTAKKTYHDAPKDAIIVARTVPMALGFSPKSVLQGRSGLCIGKAGSELEPGRCRRTDGKKWRCRREVVPDQKYCPRHMHRGAKRLAAPFEPAPISYRATKTGPARESRGGPNTNLCISIPMSPTPSSSSTSSDTTLSDTSISAYVIGKAGS